MIDNPLQIMIANKLYKDMISNHSNNIIPANNSSGVSTQGSSTKDFKSSARKRKNVSNSDIFKLLDIFKL